MTCKDHLGNIYKTKTEMCNAWGISLSTYMFRISSGYSVKEALTTPLKPMNATLCKDHLGNIYKTKTEMCRAWGITYTSTLDIRLARGLSLEEALTYDSKNAYNIAKPCTDHLGNVFDSENSMCQTWGVSRTAYRNALAKGYSSGEALFNALVKTRNHVCQDHLGTIYKSEAEMCRHWGVSCNAYEKRRKRGFSVEKALTYSNDRFACQDHLGNTYKNHRELCKHWGISIATFRARISRGYSLEEALTLPLSTRKKGVQS